MTAAMAVGPTAVRAGETSPANVAAARRHYDKARAFYSQGAYREAISEFEAAHSLDPNAKDLVFNLGVVHEKLADIDEALKWFRLYASMDLTQQERDRADAYIKRLEGAKKELDDRQADAAPSASASAAPPPPPPEKPHNGRIDAFTIGAAGITVAAVAFGIVMAAKAEQDKPPASFVTGPNGTYTDLENRETQAHREAVLADVGFGVAILGAAATTYLYLARPRSTAPTTTGSTSVSAVPLAGGGAFFVQGSF
jgi:tetratricopeptide (TPR) repeat protein